MDKTQEKLNSINLIKRPPIIVIMGHVDHGKTSILDFIRKSRIADKEAGGITQAIGAYEIEKETKDGEMRKITFIDTPGHEAFTKMRSRGARIADIAILVVAADEGFKPQTKEALNIIKKEKIPFLVAANKIDKPNANLEIIKKVCSENEVYIEEWGGETPLVPVSAKTGEGINDLLETIILMADISDLKADSNAPAEGVIIESHLNKLRGNTATLIIKNGTLKKGDFIASENSFTSIKIFENFLGKPIGEAAFSSPVLIAGFNPLPQVGSLFKSFNSKKEAEDYVENAKTEKERGKITPKKSPEKETPILEILLILKADNQGSLEAVENEILKLENENVKIKFLSAKTGEIGEEDVKLSSISKNSIIIGFNSLVNKTAKSLSEKYLSTIQTFNIIYKITEWLREEIERRAPVEVKEETVGKIQILKVFKKDLPREVIGGKVLEGKAIKGGYLKIYKKTSELYDAPPAPPIGKITELEKNKIRSDEVKEGNEFGIAAEVKKEIKEGDILDVIERQAIKKKIY